MEQAVQRAGGYWRNLEEKRAGLRPKDREWSNDAMAVDSLYNALFFLVSGLSITHPEMFTPELRGMVEQLESTHNREIRED